MSLTLEVARRLLEAAEEEATRIGVGMSFAVLDEAGHLVALNRMDGAGFLTPHIAIGKAFTASAFQASTAELRERLEAAPYFVGAVTAMTEGRFVAGGGGLPIRIDGQVAGGMGASGGTAQQDAEVVAAALASLE